MPQGSAGPSRPHPRRSAALSGPLDQSRSFAIRDPPNYAFQPTPPPRSVRLNVGVGRHKAVRSGHEVMSSRSTSRWGRYHRLTAERPSRELLRATLRLLGTTPSRRLAVDLGCGAGVESLELLRGGWSILAVDASPSAIEQLRSAVPQKHADRRCPPRYARRPPLNASYMDSPAFSRRSDLATAGRTAGLYSACW